MHALHVSAGHLSGAGSFRSRRSPDTSRTRRHRESSYSLAAQSVANCCRLKRRQSRALRVRPRAGHAKANMQQAATATWLRRNQGEGFFARSLNGRDSNIDGCIIWRSRFQRCLHHCIKHLTKRATLSSNAPGCWPCLAGSPEMRGTRRRQHVQGRGRCTARPGQLEAEGGGRILPLLLEAVRGATKMR